MKKEEQPVLAYVGPDQFELRDGARVRRLDTKAALKFKRFGDPRARRFFDRALVKFFDAPLDGLPPFLDPHQVEGVRWILSRSRSYLAHAPGAGKTFQALFCAAFTASPFTQALFVVPPSLTANWAREATKLFELMRESGYRGLANPSRLLDIQVIPDTANQKLCDFDASILICPDSMLQRSWVHQALLARRYSLIGVDEASRLKDPGALRTKIVFGGRNGTELCPGLVYRAKRVVLLDGSPMPNRPMELWAPLYALSPESIDFKTQHEFGLKYCGAQMNDRGAWEYKHSSNEDELHRKITKNFMHVVGEERLAHPERRRGIVLMTEDPRSPKMRAWEQNFLKNFTISGAIKEEFSQGELAQHRRELGLSKTSWTSDYVRERVARGERVLVFAWHREVCETLDANLYGLRKGLVMGGVSKLDREELFEEFQAGKIDVIIGNIAAMGRGHNLQRADRVVFCEPSWTDELNKQCEKRASRKGRDVDMPVRADYIVVPNSLDERIMRTLFRKEKTVKRIIR